MTTEISNKETRSASASSFNGSSSRIFDRNGSSSSMNGSVNRVEIPVYLRYEKDATRELLIRLDSNATIKKLVSEALVKNSSRRASGSFTRSRAMSLAMDLRSSKAQTCIRVYEKESGEHVDMDAAVNLECEYVVDLTEEAKTKTAFQSSGVFRQQPKQEPSEVCIGDVFLVLSTGDVKQKQVTVETDQTIHDAVAKALEAEGLSVEQLYDIPVKDQLERDVKLDAVVTPNFFFTADLTRSDTAQQSAKKDEPNAVAPPETEDGLQTGMDETFATDFMEDDEKEKTMLECEESCDEHEHNHKREVKTAVNEEQSKPVPDNEAPHEEQPAGVLHRIADKIRHLLASLIAKLPFVSSSAH